MPSQLRSTSFSIIIRISTSWSYPNCTASLNFSRSNELCMSKPKNLSISSQRRRINATPIANKLQNTNTLVTSYYICILARTVRGRRHIFSYRPIAICSKRFKFNFMCDPCVRPSARPSRSQAAMDLGRPTQIHVVPNGKLIYSTAHCL